jgi:hypothetical protein
MMMADWAVVAQIGRHSNSPRPKSLQMNYISGMNETYSVIGVRADGSQHVMSVRLSHEDASYLKEVLLKEGIFQEVLMLLDEPQPAHETVERRSTAG